MIMHSESINELAEALAEAQQNFKPVRKTKIAKVRTRSGGEYSYNYADLSDCLDAVRGPLGENDLSLIQPVVTDDHDRMVLITTLMHTSGQYMSYELVLPVVQGRENSNYLHDTGAMLTYMKRYALCALLCISAEEDTDGMVTMHHDDLSSEDKRSFIQALKQCQNLQGLMACWKAATPAQRQAGQKVFGELKHALQQVPAPSTTEGNDHAAG